MSKAKKRENEAYQYVREMIDLKEWLPHQHIREEDVARELQMSRTPIRNALKKLHEEKLIHVEPYKGARILKPEIDSAAFYERLEFIELMLNHYIHKLEVEEFVFDTVDIRENLKRMIKVSRDSSSAFEMEEQNFWNKVLIYEKNSYSRSLLLETIYGNADTDAKVRKILQQSRQTKLNHFKQLTDYIEKGNYPYARREVRILLNQLNLNVIQGI